MNVDGKSAEKACDGLNIDVQEEGNPTWPQLVHIAGHSRANKHEGG